MSHVSDLQLDALAAGVADDAEAIEAHVASCAICAERAAELGAARAAFLRRFDMQALARQTAPPRRRPWLVGGLAAAAAALALGVLLTRPPPADTRTKGDGAAMSLFVGAGLDPLGDAAVPPGSRLRVRVDTVDRPYGRFLWVDPTGGTTALHPLRDEPAAHFEAPGWLDRPIDLDDEQRTEILIAVFCPAPFDHAAALAAQAEAGPCRVVRRPIRKAP